MKVRGNGFHALVGATLRGHGLALLSALILLMNACGGAEEEAAEPATGPQADVLEELAAAAEEEGGQLDWYYILGEEAVRPLIDTFEGRYPFVEVEVTGGPGLNLVEKILSENAADRPVADLIQGGPLEDSILVGQQDLGFDYRPEGEEQVPEERLFGEEAFIVPSYFTFHIVYNTDLVSEDEAPTSLEDLTKPEWKGRFGIDAEQIDWFAGELAFYGEEEGLDLMERLAANDPIVYTGAQGYEQMAAGALPAAVNMYSILLPEYIEEGAPMKIAQTDHVIAQPDEFIGINTTDNPRTLELFFEWLFTEEAQQIFPEHLGKTPMIEGIDVPDILKTCTGDCELFFETSENFGDFDERVQQFQELFVQ